MQNSLFDEVGCVIGALLNLDIQYTRFWSFLTTPITSDSSCQKKCGGCMKFEMTIFEWILKYLWLLNIQPLKIYISAKYHLPIRLKATFLFHLFYMHVCFFLNDFQYVAFAHPVKYIISDVICGSVSYWLLTKSASLSQQEDWPGFWGV